MALPYPTKSRTWDLGTAANGLFFDTEYDQLYENDNDLDGRVETLEAGYAWTAFTPTVQGGGTLSNVNCIYMIIGKVLFIQGRITLGTVTGSEFQISLPASKVVSALLTQSPQLVGRMSNNSASGSTYKDFTLIATAGDAFVNASVAEYAVGLSGLDPQTTSSLTANNSIISFSAAVPID